jgi:hypothetical protein
MVTVYIWNFRGANVAWGHASMHVTGGDPPGAIYISWWPQNTGRQSKIPRAPGILQNVYSVPAIVGRTYAADVTDEGQAPDHTIDLPGLDESAIKAWWRTMSTDLNARWTTLGQNCSTTVANALAKGGGDDLTEGVGGWWKQWNVVWKPDDVLDYARAIKSGLKNGRTVK